MANLALKGADLGPQAFNIRPNPPFVFLTSTTHSVLSRVDTEGRCRYFIRLSNLSLVCRARYLLDPFVTYCVHLQGPFRYLSKNQTQLPTVSCPTEAYKYTCGEKSLMLIN